MTVFGTVRGKIIGNSALILFILALTVLSIMNSASA